MKIPRSPHRWTLSPSAACELQRKLANAVREERLTGPVRLVAGGDVSFSSDGTRLVAGWVVWELATKSVIETVVAIKPVRFPYVSGLLSFREAPGLIAAARKLKCEPDVFMLDGQGVAHPRGMGIASHFGLLVDRPTLGCAKTRLYGTHDTPARSVGGSKPLMAGNRVIGRVVRMQEDVNPLYLSVGHRIRIDDAVRISLRCATKFRLPEPTRLAHHLVTAARNELLT